MNGCCCSRALWIAVAMAAVVCTYVLSIGPANWFCVNVSAPDWCISAIWWLYTPILAASEKFESIGGAVDWYLGFWVTPPPEYSPRYYN